MSGPIFTFSKAEHAEHCPGSQALQQIPRESEPGRRGTVLHRFVQQVAELGYDEALALVPDDMRAAVAEYPLDKLPTDAGQHLAEVAFAIDLRTGDARKLGENIDRRYAEHGATPRDVAGAADFVSLLGDDAVEIVELKTGRSHVTRARDNLQIGASAYAAARYYGRDRARVRLLVRREDGSGYLDAANLDAFDLDVVLDRLRAVAFAVHRAKREVAAGRWPDLREGAWCDWCPARTACPAKVALVQALGASPQTTIEDQVRDMLRPETAASAVRRMKIIDAIMAKVKAEVRKYADAVGGIDMQDGTVYGRQITRRKILVGDVAFKYLEGRFGVEVAKTACEMTTNQTDLREALRSVAPERGLTKLFRQVMSDLEADQGIEWKPRTEYSIHEREDETAAGQLEDAPPQLEEEGAA